MKRILILVLLGGLVTALSGCAPSNPSADGPTIVTTNKNFYWLLKDLIGEPLADSEGVPANAGTGDFNIELLIDSVSVDPHDFEPSAKDRLMLANADFVIYTGTDVDTFMPALLESVGFDPSNVIRLLDFNRFKEIPPNATLSTDSLEKHFNPHVWFDLETIERAAPEITKILIKANPNHEARYTSALSSFKSSIENAISTQKIYTGVFSKSSVESPTYFAPEAIANVLLNDMGLRNLTPRKMANKFANEVELSASEMLQAKELIASGDIGVFITNKQVESVQAEELLEFAKENSVATIALSETDICTDKPANESGFLTCIKSKMFEVAERWNVGLIVD